MRVIYVSLWLVGTTSSSSIVGVGGSSWKPPVSSSQSLPQLPALASTKQKKSVRWPFLPASRTSKNATQATATQPTSSNEKKPLKNSGDGPMAKSISKSTTSAFYNLFQRQPKSTTRNITVLHLEDDDEVVPTRNTTTTTTPSKTAHNTTTSKESAPSSSAAPENATTTPSTATPSTGVILLAPAQSQTSSSSAPFCYSMGRSGPSLTQLSKQSSSTTGGATSSSLVVLELWLLPVLTVVTRYWFLPWLTHWLTRLTGQTEDTVHAIQRFALEQLNDCYWRDAAALRSALAQPPRGTSRWKWKRRHGKSVRRAQRKANLKPAVDLADIYAKTVVVVEVNSLENKMTTDAFDLKSLSDIVSFLLQQHRSHAFGTSTADQHSPAELEIVLLVTSPGGSVSSFGLAAAHVQRLAKEPGIRLTVCVDQYAASGGYMIASQAHKLLAAPFATIGSVGVIMEGLNFNELVKRYGIKPLVVKAGDSKNPFTRYGEVSNKDIAHEKKSLEKVHDAFKTLIAEGRPVLQENLNEISDGSVWLGREALDLNMVDQVMTSSEYIQQRIESFDRVLKLHRANPNRNIFRLSPSNPLDLVPHLKSWAAEKLTGEGAARSLYFLVQAAGMVGMMRHVFSKGPR